MTEIVKQQVERAYEVWADRSRLPGMGLSPRAAFRAGWKAAELLLAADRYPHLTTRRRELEEKIARLQSESTGSVTVADEPARSGCLNQGDEG